MLVEKRHWTLSAGWRTVRSDGDPNTAQLVLAFGGRAQLLDPGLKNEVRAMFPNARLVGCTTAGEIVATEVHDESLAVVALTFEKGTQVRVVHQPIAQADASEAAGESLASALEGDALKYVLLLSDGINVNGSALAKGIHRRLPPGVLVTGGLAADAGRFERTLLWLDDATVSEGVIAVGLYGGRFCVGHGSLGGWDPFGPDRVITRSSGNVLYELDGAPALALYKEYLGAHAAGLPQSGLLFPLSLRATTDARPVVRTILGVNEQEGSLIFAGDMPQGHHAQLMKANFDRLVDGAQGAAGASLDALCEKTPTLALLISCVGRKLVLGQRIEEEVEGVRDVLGEQTSLIGFYSYGEIAPANGSHRCELHNQTMTVTTLRECD